MSETSLTKLFSASTATVLLDNVEIGELQNLTVREEYNVIPVNQLGSSVPVAFVPGIFNGTATARRALFDLDKVFQALAPGTDAKSLQDLVESVLPGGGNVIKTAVSLNDVIKQVSQFFNYKTTGEPFSQIISFTIKVLDIDNKEQMRIENCVLTGRSFSLDVSNIVVMQDLNIIFQKRTT